MQCQEGGWRNSLHTFVHESLWGSGDRAAHLPASCPDLRVCLPVWTGASWDFAPEIQREGRNAAEASLRPLSSPLFPWKRKLEAGARDAQRPHWFAVVVGGPVWVSGLWRRHGGGTGAFAAAQEAASTGWGARGAATAPAELSSGGLARTEPNGAESRTGGAERSRAKPSRGRAGPRSAERIRVPGRRAGLYAAE
ncbi:unnamed protein product [Rangifer tarandus platyrhynchus]|uniref:Uncharacterized protein n=1 Tax=Rangifer tarandus platyrhynchus TaxID=3082113 RepID=A0ABN9A3Q5_RANTA|nr:unnamed protein product [Rangifer tarandus platyrhynchus]